jgi:uncharacterized GH25 family protein
MPSSPSPPKRPVLLLAVAAILVVGIGAALLLMQGGSDETPANVAGGSAEEQAPELPKFEQKVAGTVESRPLDVVPPALPGEREPLVVAAGDPTGGLAGMVVDKNRRPVPDVKLAVFRGNAMLGAAFPGARRAVEGSSTSGPDGRFEFRQVPVGQPYVIVGEHESYARSEIGGLRVEKDRVAPDIVLIMSEGAVVMGMVAAKGRAGAIPNARVELYYQLDNAWAKPEEQRPYKVVFTDANGRFAFTHVSSSSIRVRVEAEGYESQSQSVSSALDSEPRDQNLSFLLGPGVSLPGRVVTERGQPVVGARIEANSVTRDAQGTSITLANEGGNFLLEGLADDSTYQVRATCAGFSDTLLQNVQVSAGHLDIVMKRRGAAAGKVSSLGGAAIKDYMLLLMKSAPNREANYLNDNRHFSAADGRFLFDNLDPGDYVLEARADEFADTRSEPFTVASGDDPPTTVDIAMSKGATVCGTVLTADGQPAGGAVVQVNENKFQDNALNQIFKSLGPDDTRERSMKASGDGRFCFSNIPAGVYQIAASRDGSAPLALDDVTIVDDSQGSNAPLELKLPPGAVISGRALSSRSRPLAYCKVQISLKDGGGFMNVDTTDATGAFTFRNLRPGQYQITVMPSVDDDDKPLHPFMVLVNAQKSRQEVFVNEGQVVEGVLIQMPAPSSSPH